MRVFDLKDLRHTARKALDNGGQFTGRATITWRVSGNCSDPQHVTLAGRPCQMPDKVRWKHDASKLGRNDPRLFDTQLVRERVDIVDGLKNNPLWVDIEARCRKCDRCLAARARLWRDRAISELRASSRTWLGSMTLTSEHHFKIMCVASSRLAKSGVSWDSLSEAEQRRERHTEISKEITRWLKRVRERSNARLRLLVVMEPHKSGLPHYHCLIHEGATPVTKRVMQKAWHLGFTNFKLVETSGPDHARAAWYVAKYLTKTNEARVRASVRYGDPLSMHSDSVLNIDPPSSDFRVAQPYPRKSVFPLSQTCEPVQPGESTEGEG